MGSTYNFPASWVSYLSRKTFFIMRLIKPQFHADIIELDLKASLFFNGLLTILISDYP